MSFVTPLSDVHVYEKDEARFELEVSREPKTFRWLKGTQELENDDKFEIIQEGKRYTLVVKAAGFSDEAKYTFEGEDKRTSGKLVIEGRSSRCLGQKIWCGVILTFGDQLVDMCLFFQVFVLSLSSRLRM